MESGEGEEGVGEGKRVLTVNWQWEQNYDKLDGEQMTTGGRLPSMIFLLVFQKLLMIAESLVAVFTAVNWSSLYLMNPSHVITKSSVCFTVEIAQPTFEGSVFAVESKIDKK